MRPVIFVLYDLPEIRDKRPEQNAFSFLASFVYRVAVQPTLLWRNYINAFAANDMLHVSSLGLLPAVGSAVTMETVGCDVTGIYTFPFKQRLLLYSTCT